MTPSHLHTVSDPDGAAVLDTERGMISLLNPTGAYVWQGLQRGDTVGTIVADLATRSGEDASVIEGDVNDFIQSLKEHHLLLR